MARLDWDRERRRKSARRAKPQLQLRLERELAAATSRFFAESQPQNKRKPRAQAIESRYTTKLPFLATIKAGDRNGAQQRQSDSGRSCANSPPRLGQAFRRSAPAVRSQSQRRAPRGRFAKRGRASTPGRPGSNFVRSVPVFRSAASFARRARRTLAALWQPRTCRRHRGGSREHAAARPRAQDRQAVPTRRALCGASTAPA
jgi:hypothetical protein